MGFLTPFVIVITKLEPAAASEVKVAVTVLAPLSFVQVWLVEEMDAVHEPDDCTAISLGKVISSCPPLDGIKFLRIIVNLYSVISPTTIVPLGELTLIEVKEFTINEKPLVVTAVPESIRYPSVVCVFASNDVLIALVDPGLYTSVIEYDSMDPDAHPALHALVMVRLLTLLLASAVLVHVLAVDVEVSVHTTAVEEALYTASEGKVSFTWPPACTSVTTVKEIMYEVCSPTLLVAASLATEMSVRVPGVRLGENCTPVVISSMVGFPVSWVLMVKIWTVELRGLVTQLGLRASFKVKLIVDPAVHSAPVLHH